MFMLLVSMHNVPCMLNIRMKRQVVTGRQGGYRSPATDGLVAEAVAAAQAYIAHACGGHGSALFERCAGE